MTRPSSWILAILASAWIGCASSPAPARHWEKPGADAADLDRDLNACVASAMEGDNDARPSYEHHVRGRAFFQCMHDRDWKVVEE